MGFRTTLTTLDYATRLPDWFLEKYSYSYFIDGTLVSSKRESKQYGDDFLLDYQKALIESGFFDSGLKETNLVAMGEDGVITKVIISLESIKYIWFFDDDGFESDHIWC